jgi:hypothetical protein
MGRARAIVLVGVAGCYEPVAATGAPCDERMICPSDQVCVDFRCQLPGTVSMRDSSIDTSTIDAPPDAFAPLGPWSAPVSLGLLPGVAKTDPSFTPDRLTIVFVSTNNLFLATRAAIGGAFAVTELTVLNSTMDDKSPEITPDGKTIYFTSNRDGNYDVFAAANVNDVWQAPTKIAVWSGTGNEQDVAIAPDERTAWVAVGGDILRATRANKTDAWPAAVDMNVTWGTSPTAPTTNTAGDVYFHADASRNIWVARRQGNAYAMPVLVPELNSTGRDAAPYVSANDRHIMFERDADIFESSR